MVRSVMSGILVLALALELAACAPQPAVVVHVPSGNTPSGSAAVTERNGSPPARTGGSAAGAPADCTAICQAARSMDAAACVEGAFEQLGFGMDARSCNDWEGAAATGMGGDPCTLLSSCQADEGFTAAHCGTVRASCGL